MVWFSPPNSKFRAVTSSVGAVWSNLPARHGKYRLSVFHYNFGRHNFVIFKAVYIGYLRVFFISHIFQHFKSVLHQIWEIECVCPQILRVSFTEYDIFTRFIYTSTGHSSVRCQRWGVGGGGH